MCSGVVVALLLAAVANAQDTEDRAAAAIRRGEQFFAAGDFGAALKEYRKAQRSPQGALDEAAKYLKTPFERPKRVAP